MNTKHHLFCIAVAFCLAGLFPFQSAEAIPSHETVWMPTNQVAGVNQPTLLLNGTWQFQYSPQSKWSTIQVPGEPAMQGYALKHDSPVRYRKQIQVPADYAGKRMILRFDGVYSYARLLVNDTFVREHHGGFTRWETDVTSLLKAGKKNTIELEVTDRLDDISYASGYAHHTIGGILRDVSLRALPVASLTDFGVETPLDSLSGQATLRLSFVPVEAQGTEVSYTLTDPSGCPVSLPQSTFPIGETSDVVTHTLPVSRPVLWDAEHPALYTLTVSLRREGQSLSSFSKEIGIREIKIVGNRMLVNGQPVKLRGACRHDIHPTLGRTTTAELDSLDALLFRRSNMNFVRTSHYPPSEAFLRYCDRYGIYVECETAVCFMNTHGQKNYAPHRQNHDDPAFADRYLSQCREMVKNFRSHASIILWSIGNESTYGSNFQLSWDWVKAADTTRPVIFSYPGSTKEHKIYDILSMHYQDVNGNLNQWGIPVTNFQGEGLPTLFDEWAHPACYTYATLQNDPNIREFWGESLDKMWSGLFEVPGGLGGAIWGYIDETFMLPEPKQGSSFWKEFAYTAKPEGYQGNCVGYGEWGIVDVWRREKPEFWATKKAYSPVRLMQTKVADVTSGERLFLTLYNRFDHTRLDEIKAAYTYQGTRHELPLPAVKPHQKGLLLIPAEAWKTGESLLVEFFTADGQLIDAEQLQLGTSMPELALTKRSGALRVEETTDRLVIKGNGFEIPFDKFSGLIHNATADGQVIIEKGPFLYADINLNHLSGAEVRAKAANYLIADADWKKKVLTYVTRPDRVEVSIQGSCQQVDVAMLITVYPTGQLSVSYSTSGEPNGYVREMGLTFDLPATADHLRWKRKGYWSYYPSESFAGNEGETSLYNVHTVAYGENPAQRWEEDTHNYYYWADAGANCSQPLTQKAKGMKEQIYSYTLAAKGGKETLLSVISLDGSVACRTHKRADGRLVLHVNNQWDYPEIAWGNYCKKLEATPCYGVVSLHF